MSDSDAEETSWEQRGADETVYCFCKKRDDGYFMISCEGCAEWFHGKCVGIPEQDGQYVEAYYCMECNKQGKGVTRWNPAFRKRVAETQPDDGTLKKKLKRSSDVAPTFTEFGTKIEDINRPEITQRNERERLRQAQLARQREALEKGPRPNQTNIRSSREVIMERTQTGPRPNSEELMKRMNYSAVLAEALQTGFEIDAQNNVGTGPSGTDLTKIAKEIEGALFFKFKGVSKDYLQLFRSLLFNLKDDKNFSLRSRIGDGSLKADELVNMDPRDMANQEIARFREEREKAAFDSLYIADQQGSAGLRHPKGSVAPVAIPDVLPVEPEIRNSQDPELAKLTPKSKLQQHQGGVSRPKVVQPKIGDELDEFIQEASRSATSSPPQDQAAKTKSQCTICGSFDHAATTCFLRKNVSAPKKQQPRSTPAEKEPEIEIEMTQLDQFGTTKFEPLEDVEMAQEDEYNPALPHGSPAHQPTQPVWTGYISYQINENTDLSLSAYHINGPLIEEHLPLVLNIENRMDLNQCLSYLPKIDFSSSRNRTCVYFEATEESGKKDYAKVFKLLRSISRAGVISIQKRSVIGVQPTFFKELYLIPLAASDPVPPFIKSHEYDRDLEDMLIGVFLTEKEIQLVNTFTIPPEEDEPMEPVLTTHHQPEPVDQAYLMKSLQAQQEQALQQQNPGLLSSDIFSSLDFLSKSKTLSEITREAADDSMPSEVGEGMGGFGTFPPHQHMDPNMLAHMAHAQGYMMNPGNAMMHTAAGNAELEQLAQMIQSGQIQIPALAAAGIGATGFDVGQLTQMALGDYYGHGQGVHGGHHAHAQHQAVGPGGDHHHHGGFNDNHKGRGPQMRGGRKGGHFPRRGGR